MSEQNVINESCQDAVIDAGSALSAATSFTALKTILDNWSQWTATDLENLDDLEILESSLWQSAVATIRYSLNGKEGLVYMWGRPKDKAGPGPTLLSEFGTSPNGILVIPGSGLNEGYALINATSTYENMFTMACPAGDAFIYQYPGQDMRSIVGENGKKLLLSSIDNYLRVKGTSVSILCLIEIAACMQFIRTANEVIDEFPEYTKTAIMGLSKGAWLSMMGAVYNEPTACVIASGVSLKEYRSLGFGAIGGNCTAELISKDDLIAAITGSSTQFYFTVSTTLPELAYCSEEASDDETATALAGSNFTYHKHAQGHHYPMPETKNWLLDALA